MGSPRMIDPSTHRTMSATSRSLMTTVQIITFEVVNKHMFFQCLLTMTICSITNVSIVTHTLAVLTVGVRVALVALVN